MIFTHLDLDGSTHEKFVGDQFVASHGGEVEGSATIIVDSIHVCTFWHKEHHNTVVRIRIDGNAFALKNKINTD